MTLTVMNGGSSGRHVFSMSGGSGSSSHDFDGELIMADLMSLTVQSWKWSKTSVAGGSSVVTSPSVFSSSTETRRSFIIEYPRLDVRKLSSMYICERLQLLPVMSSCQNTMISAVRVPVVDDFCFL